MIPVLKKVAQLNIKQATEQNGTLIIDVCTGAPPNEATALSWPLFRDSQTLVVLCLKDCSKRLVNK